MIKSLKQLAIIIFVVLIGILITSCGDMGTGPQYQSGPLIISGTIGGAGPSPSILSRSAMPDPSMVKRFTGTVQSDSTITGVLEDGDMMFRLTGVYDPSSKAFSMQAASSSMVFALTGKLNNSNTIIPSESQALLHVKDAEGHWETVSLGAMSSSGTTVSGSANVEEKLPMPQWTRGIWYDQFTGLIIAVTENAVTISDGETVLPQNVLEIEIKNEAIGSRVIEIITRAVYFDEDFGNSPVNYTSRFYIAEKWDSTLHSNIGSVKINDMFDYIEGDIGNKTLTEAESEMTGTRIFIAPFISNAVSGVIKEFDDVLTGGYSPMFTPNAAGTAAAKAAFKLGAIPTFMMALQYQMNSYFVPEAGKLTITGLDEFN